MPQFYCFHCGQHIDAHADLAGWEADCPACGGTITVPGASKPDPAPSSLEDMAIDFLPPSVTSAVAPIPALPKPEPVVAPPLARTMEPAAPSPAVAPEVAVVAPPPQDQLPAVKPVPELKVEPMPELVAAPATASGSGSEAQGSSVDEVVSTYTTTATTETATAYFHVEIPAPSPPLQSPSESAEARSPEILPPAAKAVEEPALIPSAVPVAEVAAAVSASPVSPSETAESPTETIVSAPEPIIETPTAKSDPVSESPSTNASAPRSQWEPSRKYVPVEPPRDPNLPLTTIPSTVSFMVWMFGGALAQVGLMLGAGEGSVIRERCEHSLLFLLTSSLVVLAVTGTLGFLLGMLIAMIRRRSVGTFGSSFCIAMLALGIFLLGSGGLWCRSGWPKLAPALDTLLSPFRVRPEPKMDPDSAKDDETEKDKASEQEQGK